MKEISKFNSRLDYDLSEKVTDLGALIEQVPTEDLKQTIININRALIEDLTVDIQIHTLLNLHKQLLNEEVILKYKDDSIERLRDQLRQNKYTKHPTRYEQVLMLFYRREGESVTFSEITAQFPSDTKEPEQAAWSLLNRLNRKLQDFNLQIRQTDNEESSYDMYIFLADDSQRD